MTYGSIAKDFLKKVVLPVFLAWLLFAMFTPVFTTDGVTDYFKVWLVCGIPFGIWRVRMWLIPSGFDLGGTLGVWAINFILGGLIGSVIIAWRLLVAAWYIILTAYRLITYNSESNRMAREIVSQMVTETQQA